MGKIQELKSTRSMPQSRGLELEGGGGGLGPIKVMCTSFLFKQYFRTGRARFKCHGPVYEPLKEFHSVPCTDPWGWGG